MNALGLYSRDVRAHPMMPPAEQQALACRFASGHDPQDAQRLVLANLRLVISIATNLGGGRRPDLMDLIQEGNAGLMLAIERFDPDRGSTLSAYASIWIRAYILRQIMETSHVVRVTTTREGRLRFFARTLPRDVHLDAPAGHQGDDGGTRPPRLDFVRADEQLRPDVAAEKHEDLRRLRSAVRRFAARMDTRERAILEHRLLSDTPRPLRQLGAAMGLSGERVRQVEQDMVSRLRALIVEPLPTTFKRRHGAAPATTGYSSPQETTGGLITPINREIGDDARGVDVCQESRALRRSVHKAARMNPIDALRFE